MKNSHIAITGLIIIASVGLAGFKTTAPSSVDSAKKPHRNTVARKTLSKPLDLTLPSNTINIQETGGILAVVEADLATSRTETALTQRKTRPLELKGNVIMSQDPEIEKAKTADGAGITINLRH